MQIASTLVAAALVLAWLAGQLLQAHGVPVAPETVIAIATAAGVGFVYGLVWRTRANDDDED
jgi:hypothetical protein